MGFHAYSPSEDRETTGVQQEFPELVKFLEMGRVGLQVILSPSPWTYVQRWPLGGRAGTSQRGECAYLEGLWEDDGKGCVALPCAETTVCWVKTMFYGRTHKLLVLHI